MIERGSLQIEDEEHAPRPALAGQAPPHDREAEQAVLGALMIDGESMFTIRDILEPTDFFIERHSLIYSASRSLSDRGEPIEPLALKTELETHGNLERSGGLDYLATLAGIVPTAANIRHYADIVIQHSRRRRLITTARTIAQMGHDTATPIGEILDHAEQEVFSLGTSQRQSDATHIEPLLKSTWELLETRLEDKKLVYGVPTNFPSLDSITQGLQPGELIILAARPSVGKTSFSLNLARNASFLAKKPTVVFSLEMSKHSLVQRLICSEAHVDSFLLKTGQADAAAFQRIAKAMDDLSHAALWIDDTPQLSISTLRARARRMKAQLGIEFIIIDYLQLMRGGRQDNRVQEVSEISAGLKALAKELNVPILALSQLSRESERRENRRPQLSDLRDSGSIEQDADVVLFLYRPGMHREDIDRSQTELIVAKNRNGPVKDIELVFVAAQTAFREPYKGEDTEH